MHSNGRETAMKSAIVKRSVVIGGHKTSVSLEDAFWQRLKDIARVQETTLSQTIAEIDVQRRHGNLSSAIRTFVIEQLAPRAGSGPVLHHDRRLSAQKDRALT
jgi:predicted DNA-binding ribbon-helix-helix protein